MVKYLPIFLLFANSEFCIYEFVSWEVLTYCINVTHFCLSLKTSYHMETRTIDLAFCLSPGLQQAAHRVHVI